MIRCNLSSVVVLDQQKAEDFYVGVLGFKKKHDFPAGGARWLTVVAADGSGAELALEPAGYDFAKAYQKALYDHGIPFTSLGCDDVEAEYERLTAKGVKFRGGPQKHADFPTTAIFEDTCGNLIMLHEA
ncbi:VOC family protein [Nitratireductor sp. GCM10026969]|uniref:VOC family protein n=1 Tax=Nitratireductor sp. GCM10026969 TaxID=3252645 RepID=UPI00360EB367